MCTTTDNPDGGSNYYPNTYCNGRVWIQVLAQRLGITYSASKNVSYFYHLSSEVVTNMIGFAPSDASNSLFVVWVNDADFVQDMDKIYPSLDLATWNSAISTSLANHQTVVQSLYAKGARTVVMPTVVDITKTPQYSGMTSSEKAFIRGRIAYFNTNMVTMLAQVKAAHPDLTICVPDFFALLDDMAASPAVYGFTNVTSYAIVNGSTPLNGPRAGYLWWDPWDPTAMAHEIMGDTVHQMLAPVRINEVTWLDSSNRLDLVNVPIGLGGYVQGRTNLVLGSWSAVASFSSTNTAQAVYVPVSGQHQFYRLKFPFVWSWP